MHRGAACLMVGNEEKNENRRSISKAISLVLDTRWTCDDA